jgi:arylsulfatase A
MNHRWKFSIKKLNSLKIKSFMFFRFQKSIVILFLFLTAIAFGQGQSSKTAKALKKNKQPNIIFILADDIGYESFSTYGSASYQTPNIDKLADKGVKFTHCYSTPLCTPSRVMVMTGKYNFRNYTDFGYLNSSEKNFAHLFKEAGYATCIAGKWQLNGIAQKKADWQNANRPKEFGFDEYCLWQLNSPKKDGERFANPLIVQNGQVLPRQRDAYGPDIFCDYILDFIDRKKDDEQPFFAYYPMALVHDPFVPTPASDDWSDTSKRYSADNKYFKDMVAYMDKNVGGVLDKLEQAGIAENTLVIFSGDNGTNVAITSKMKNGQSVKGEKGYLTDGGTRVPLVAYWKGKSAKGVVNTDLVDFSDFLPTMMHAAGIALPKDFVTDGRSFLPQVLGQKGNAKEVVYMYYEPQWAGFENGVFARDKTYKLYGDGRFYNVEKDVLEQNDLNGKTLTAKEQAIKKKLEAVLKKYPNVKPLPEEERARWRNMRVES